MVTIGEVAVEKKSPLKDLYSPLTREELSEGKLALIIIDMQYNITAQGHGVLKHAKELGVREGYEYYHDRIQNDIIPNVQELLKKFRESEKIIVFTKIRSTSFNGKKEDIDSEGSDSKEGVILKEVEPTENDVVITKDDPDIFQGTELDSHLRESGVDTLVITGVLTNECVEASVLQAVENDYRVILVEDSTAAFSEEIHEKALDLIQKNSTIITSTDDILRLV
ncbi:MAG: cysteine hydrolase [Candidatus Thermoplasmatota archaeon]|nr:cysteine hydrolase [Candidatus Thermoplasmatota archaeon]